MIAGADAEAWRSALDMINSGEMPPKGKQTFTEDERQLVVAWMTDSLHEAAIAHRGTNKPVIRRLTKQQYTNSLQELLGVAVNFGKVLPDDGKSEMGFSNNGEVLQMSSLHAEYYQKIARQALDKAIVTADPPKKVHYRINIGTNKGAKRQSDDAGRLPIRIDK